MRMRIPYQGQSRMGLLSSWNSIYISQHEKTRHSSAKTPKDRKTTNRCTNLAQRPWLA